MSSIRTELLQNRMEDRIEDPDDIMLEIMEIFTELEIIPNIGKYYTFIYQPKTPDLRYDQFPLIACIDIFPWGFRGVNFHWNDYRNYTWMEVQGQLHVIEEDEIDDMRQIPYAKYLLNR